MRRVLGDVVRSMSPARGLGAGPLGIGECAAGMSVASNGVPDYNQPMNRRPCLGLGGPTRPAAHLRALPAPNPGRHAEAAHATLAIQRRKTVDGFATDADAPVRPS